MLQSHIMDRGEKTNQGRYLFLFDFDGTLADTFSPSPNNIGVNEAYEGAITQIFGGRGLDVYREIGGLKNNAPSELIGRMLKQDKSLITCAKSKLLSGKHGSLDWNEENPSQTITEFLIQEKLKISLREIGPSWPEPFNGVVPMLKYIEELNNDGIDIDIGIVTSGHTKFVEKVLQAWGVKGPNICITDDDLRYKYPLQPKPEDERLIKPSQTLFSIARAKWLRQHDIEPVNTNFDFALGLREYVVYFGDDSVKDGEFALNSKLLFGLFDKDGKSKKEEQGRTTFTFSDWGKLSKKLLSKKTIKAMREGKKMQEVFALILKESEQPQDSGMQIKMR